MDSSEIEMFARLLRDSLARSFTAAVGGDRRYPVNVVDVIDDAAHKLGRIARAITPPDASAMTTPNGGKVGSLTEAVIYAAESLTEIAVAISDLASAVRERND